VREHIGLVGFDPSYGARPVKRAIQNLIQNPLAKEILSGKVKDGNRIRVCKKGIGLEFSVL
jgi:ATP-dependent Clp protease ATP-binding subunit ClpB